MHEDSEEKIEESLEDIGLSDENSSKIELPTKAIEEVDKEIKELLRAKQYKDAKDMINTVLEDKTLSEEEIATIKMRLITVSVIEKNRKKARDIAYDILGNKDVSEDTKTRAKIKLFEIAFESLEYKEAVKWRNKLKSALDNGKISEKNEIILKVNFIKLSIIEGHYNEAKVLIENILKDKESPSYFVARRLLVETMMSEENYEGAKEFAQKILSDTQTDKREKTILVGNLVEIATLEGDIEKVEELSQGILDDGEIPNRYKKKVLKQLDTVKKDYELGRDIAVEQKCRLDAVKIENLTSLERLKEAKEIGNRIISNKDASDDIKAGIIGKLIKIARLEDDYKIIEEYMDILDGYQLTEYGKEKSLKRVEIAIRLKKGYEKKKAMQDEDNKQEDELVNLSEEDKKEDDELVNLSEEDKKEDDELVNLSKEDKKLLEHSAIYKHYKYNRENLYAGEISVDDLTDLVEKNSGTLMGCLFVAEVYKYFKAEELGKKWLTAYKRKNPDMPVADKKAIAGAMNILDIKNPVVPIGRIKELWNDLYKKHESTTILEEHPVDGGLR